MRTHTSHLRALLLLNAALLLVLAGVTLGPAADAQPRARGDYTMVAGRAPGTQSSAVYIVDSVNQEMVVVTYNPSTNQLEGVTYRHLGADVQQTMQHPGQPRGR